MPTRPARALLILFVVLLFVGTLMPGGWKASAARPFSQALDVAMWAHVCLFAMICFLLPFAGIRVLRPWQVPLIGLTLALLTEGLQFLAVERHPNLAGVLQDLAGTAIGWALAHLAARRAALRRARTQP